MLFDLKIPLLGFESVKKLELRKIDDFFMRLKTPDAEEPSFTLVNPFVLCDYAFDIPTPIQEMMEITNDTNLLIFNIIIVQTPIEKSTINFVAPLIFNTDNQTMAQIIINEPLKYGIAEPIATFLEAKAEADA